MKKWLTRDEDPKFGDWELWFDVNPVNDDGVWRSRNDGGRSMEEGIAKAIAKDSGIILQPGECKRMRIKMEVIE